MVIIHTINDLLFNLFPKAVENGKNKNLGGILEDVVARVSLLLINRILQGINLSYHHPVSSASSSLRKSCDAGRRQLFLFLSPLLDK